MHSLNHSWRVLAAIGLLAIGLVSCQKQGALPATAGNSTLKTALTI